MSEKPNQKHPSISAAFTRDMPERLRGTPEKKPSPTNGPEEVRPTVHDAAKESAKRGKTLMVFMQADNKSVPYEEYRRHLDAGGLPTGTPKPVALKIEDSKSTPPEIPLQGVEPDEQIPTSGKAV